LNRSTRKPPDRGEQLAYSDQQPLMLDEESRRRKASKILAVLRHFVGASDLSGLSALDIGCSAGIIANELHLAGAEVTGVDIDRPGIERARARFGESGPKFLEYSGTTLPFPDGTVDVIVYNHVYEHTADPDQVMSEIRRVLSDRGVVYLGLGNRFGIVEPHYHLPFLSWIPPRMADRYVRLAGRGDQYYERFKTRRGLRRMCAGLRVWDYTYCVLAQPGSFGANDMVRGPLTRVPPRMWRALTPLIPTYIWVGSVSRDPAGEPLAVPPELVIP
jgi:SAM-dependent methyltransferase